MDPKKQELNPELKQIYDRVMNTQVKTQAPTSAPAVSSQPTLSVPASPSQGGQNPSAPPPPASVPPGGASQPGASAPPVGGIQSTPFVFTGNKITTPQLSQTSQPQMNTAPAKKISGPMIAVGVVILIVIWAFFWAKIFGLI
ncbi:MAG: hypothetical protein A3C30_01900 [Candidatus Levybacteria bacterium RIFCSPHIGHO2_02_FULL_40_18]|nr:MAG: hypothetical protein A2869_04280 [Candidatus Levybacteria bacterium RIFCSPHIGHO2_01_FULL_40_58]OGH26744.1 MAG: hypothetical protein A3C30_01900 [Candidatus Levybacteria bacterium RIFCSPHIGHO2_02_FULL_40_18]OGH31679.1 MAG: hypothetical protein A3E43_01620 [Candidatus Levybacteria bacterium RIFCSPHIGHO2_12_FULL_40_31]OGH40579.1 MAG: hypothetical protein A2894_00170 [Candidatus Levybacteria bacterium RIFCSPLOWO2_01_FULL_40_64]OGH48754.1 MAG: hypothetical protein A3I54_03795 [Candidatus Lev